MLNTIKDIKNRPAQSITEPVLLAEAKAWMIIDHTDDDALITRLISQARAQIESKTHISVIERVVVVTVDLVREFKLPHGPTRSIDEVIFRKGTNADGTPDNETLTIEEYTTDGVDFKVFKSNKCGRHKITCTTGFGTDGEDWDCPVPEDLKNAVLAQTAFLYENRGDKNSAGKFSDLAMEFIKPYIQQAHI